MGAGQQALLGTGAASSSFTPPSWKLWVETDQLVGFANNDPVAAWANAGNGGTNYDLAQTTSAKKPLYKTGGPNGKPYLNFNNANNQTMKVNSTSVVNDNVGTMLLVLSPVSQAGTAQAGFIGRKFGLYYLADGAGHHWGVYLNGFQLSSIALSIGTWYVLGLVVSATNSVNLYTGLTSVTRTGGTAYDAKAAAYIVSNNDAEQWGGLNIVAVGYDDSAVDSATMTSLINSLGTKYGISV